LADEQVLHALSGKEIQGIESLVLITPERAICISRRTGFLDSDAPWLTQVYWRDTARVEANPSGTYHLHPTALIFTAPKGVRTLSITGYANAGEISVRFAINSMDRQKFLEVVELVQRQVAAAKAVAKTDGVVSPTTTQPPTFLDELERLGKLKQQGMLTEEEFQMAKRKLLAI